jgi:hypothetical protein
LPEEGEVYTLADIHFYERNQMRKPFYRKSHKCWYVKDENGKFIRIDPDEEVAWEIYEVDYLPRFQARRKSKAALLIEAKEAIEANACDPGSVCYVDETVPPMPPVPRGLLKASDVSKMKPFPGIYFCWREGRVVYIGESQNVPRRMYTHSVIKWTDMVSVLPCSDHQHAELFYIWLLKPPLNRSISRGRMPARKIYGKNKKKRTSIEADAADRDDVASMVSVPVPDLHPESKASASPLIPNTYD